MGMPHAFHFPDIVWAELLLLGLALRKDAQTPSGESLYAWCTVLTHDREPPPAYEINAPIRLTTHTAQKHREMAMQQLQGSMLKGSAFVNG